MTYASEVTADTPVSWWRLDETSGTNAEDDGSGTDADGTYTGGFTLDRVGIDGSGSVLFNGTSGYITVGSLPAKLQFGGNFTIEAWVYIPLAVTITPGAAVVTEAFAGDGNVRYMLGFHNGSGNTLKPSFGWYNGSWRLAISGDDLTTEEWHHLVGTWDGTQLELFVDKVSKATQATVGTPPTGTETLYIGKRWDAGGNQFFNGYIDEVALYSVELAGARIDAHYDARNIEHVNSQFTDAEWEAAGSSTAVRQFGSMEWEAAGQKSNVQRMFGGLMWEVAVTSPDEGTAYWGILLQ